MKPSAAGLATNLVITTDRHVYHLSLTSTARTAMAALSWTYPQDQLIALAEARPRRRERPRRSPSGLAIDQLHFGYAVSGDKPDWRPLRAFDDGRQTFIEFPAKIATRRSAAAVRRRREGRGRAGRTTGCAAVSMWSTACSTSPSCASA